MCIDCVDYLIKVKPKVNAAYAAISLVLGCAAMITLCVMTKYGLHMHEYMKRTLIHLPLMIVLTGSVLACFFNVFFLCSKVISAQPTRVFDTVELELQLRDVARG